MRKQIPVSALKMGMHIDEFCGSWLEHPFWCASFTLHKASDLARIQKSKVSHVWIDSDRGLDCEAGQSLAVTDQQADRILTTVAGMPADTFVPPRRTTMEEELLRAERICSKSRVAVKQMFQEVRMGRAIDAAGADKLVNEISESVARNPDALISMARLKTLNDYTYMHSVAVCALMIALGRHMKLGEAELREAGMAGLLHDVGKMAIPNEILNKAGRLTEHEFSRVLAHPREGYNLLKAGGGVSEIALDVCLHHHEKIDGTGYPDKLVGDNISLFARMGAVCDVYDAITSDRPYKNGWNPAEALHKMAEWKSDHFDEAIFFSFVKCLGIYPVGSLVKLKSGRLGIIVEQSEKSLAAPKVKVFYSINSGSRIVPELVDLSLRGSDLIVSREDPVKWRFPDLSKLWHSQPAA